MASIRLPKATLRQYLIDRGAQQVSPSALEEYRLEAEAYLAALAEASVMAAKHANRMKILRVQKDDIVDVMQIFRVMSTLQVERK
jgi:histone H3/H4